MTAPTTDASAQAHGALNRTRWVGPIAGVLLCSAALTAVGIWTISESLSMSIPLIAGASLALFSVLEVGVRRNARLRQAPAKQLLRDLIDQVSAPEVGWMRGLPMLRGLVGTRAFALSVDSAPNDRLRLGLTISAQPTTPVFLASRQPNDFPEKLITRLLTRQSYVVFDADGESLCALSLQPDLANQAYDIDTLRPILNAQAPHCVTLDGGFETVRWDTLLTDAITPATIVDLVTTLPPLFEIKLEVEPEETPDLPLEEAREGTDDLEPPAATPDAALAEDANPVV